MIRYVKRYTRSEIRANPNTLYVFGDNLERRGLGGQAKECRGEPNAVGIPTKRSPSMAESSFLSDADFEEVRPIIQAAFRKLASYDGPIVWPEDGVGTGLAQLPQRAPRIAAFIDRCFEHFKNTR